ncbi:hypothetical protein HDV04_001169 [Boothiomyces sp. JEL0838]|nr:hypothetical protein HDV04_001169 [Boothiomyces sp. JEL0838]
MENQSILGSIYGSVKTKFNSIYNEINSVLSSRTKRNKIVSTPGKITKRRVKTFETPKRRRAAEQVEEEEEPDRLRLVEKKIQWLVDQQLTNFDGYLQPQFTPTKERETPTKIDSLQPTPLISLEQNIPELTSQMNSPLLHKAPVPPPPPPVTKRVDTPIPMKNLLLEMKQVVLKPVEQRVLKERQDHESLLKKQLEKRLSFIQQEEEIENDEWDS